MGLLGLTPPLPLPVVGVERLCRCGHLPFWMHPLHSALPGCLLRCSEALKTRACSSLHEGMRMAMGWSGRGCPNLVGVRKGSRGGDGCPLIIPRSCRLRPSGSSGGASCHQGSLLWTGECRRFCPCFPPAASCDRCHWSHCLLCLLPGVR